VAAICLVIAALALALAFTVLSKPKAPVLMTAPVVVGDVEKTVLATGTVIPFRQIDVGSRASGAITSLKVDVGDQVAAGDLIAEIDSATQTNNLNIALAALNDVQAQKLADQAALDLARQTSDRAVALLKADAGAKADAEAALRALKNAQAVLKSVNAQIDQATISVKTARVNLGYTKIVAPFAGTVLVVATKQGQTVNAAQSAPTIVTLGQLDKMTINAQIAEADVINVRPGMAVYFTILGDPDHRYSGRLRRIEPAPSAYVSAAAATLALATTSSAAAVYYNGLFDVDNPDARLKTTMTANVSIVLKQAKRVLTIPASALGDAASDGSYSVKVMGRDKKAVARRIIVGLNDGARVQVLSGLVAGDQVVVGEAASPPAAGAATKTPTRGMPRNVGGL
jgi:macrolide-specific efflux system membrane fusion protein